MPQIFLTEYYNGKYELTLGDRTLNVRDVQQAKWLALAYATNRQLPIRSFVVYLKNGTTRKETFC